MSDEPGEDPLPQHILRELGFAVRRHGSELHGHASVTPEMHAPGTDQLRTSILATWTDTLAGLLAAEAMSPRVPVTLELDVHLYRPAPASGAVRGTARTLKQGRTVFVGTVEFASDDGTPLAVGAGSFMSTPDPNVRLPPNLSIDALPSRERLSVPLAERAGCTQPEPGVAVLPRSEDGLNSSRTVNGGLIALVAEEAALSLSPGAALCSLGLRYLQAARVGPVVATARAHDGLGVVELRDRGNHNRLCVVATTRTFLGRPTGDRDLTPTGRPAGRDAAEGHAWS